MKENASHTWLYVLAAVLMLFAAAAGYTANTKYHILCLHDWAEATCYEPAVCEICGKTRGEPAGHDWLPASCESPETCARCGEVRHVALGHTWLPATCTEPPVCERCGITNGEPAGHQWKEADCQHPKTCSVCGLTEGETGTHDWLPADCTNPETCSVCGSTRGSALGHTWQPAACTEPKTCSVCGISEGEPAGHVWLPATPDAPKTCEVCGATDGQPLDMAEDAAAVIDARGQGRVPVYAEDDENSDIAGYFADGAQVRTWLTHSDTMIYCNLDDVYGYVKAENISRPNANPGNEDGAGDGRITYRSGWQELGGGIWVRPDYAELRGDWLTVKFDIENRGSAAQDRHISVRINGRELTALSDDTYHFAAGETLEGRTAEGSVRDAFGINMAVRTDNGYASANVYSIADVQSICIMDDDGNAVTF